MNETSKILSGLSSCAGFVVAPKLQNKIKHIEFIRLNSVNKNEMSIISRGCAGVCNGTLIINTPGSPDGVRDSLDYVKPVLPHAISLILGTDTSHSSTN